MTTLDERMAAAKANEHNRAIELDRTAQLAAAVFDTENGRELLGYLAKRYDLLGRVFIPSDRGDVNALRAATRDGERAVVNHLLKLVRKANEKFPFPL